MARKALRFLLPASVAILAASQWREIARYLKISQMSRGDGHPQLVPAAGQHDFFASFDTRKKLRQCGLCYVDCDDFHGTSLS